MMARPYETLDLSMLEGITTYVDTILLADVRKAFAMGRGVQAFGVALGTMANGKKLPRPQVMAVGNYGMGFRNLKRNLRSMAKNTKATGTILLQIATVERTGPTGEDEVVLVQLEHMQFGDLVWTASVTDGKLGEFEGPLPLPEASYNVTRTELLPGRWMH